MTRADRLALLRAARLLEQWAAEIWDSNCNRFGPDIGKMTDAGAIKDHAANSNAAKELRAIAKRKA
jgi:hypothetical protein